MCSIIASRSNNKIEDLVRINQHRGNFSYSITTAEDTIKEFGVFDLSKLKNFSESSYKICHVQAPTGGLISDTNRIHPVVVSNSSLWHNGILVPRAVRMLQQELNSDSSFDTFLMCSYLDKSDNWMELLSNIEGLFACIYKRGDEYFMFRTKHGKLYIDDNLNISSERFENSLCINYDTVYKIDVDNNSVSVVGTFKTLKFNIVVAGELILN